MLAILARTLNNKNKLKQTKTNKTKNNKSDIRNCDTLYGIHKIICSRIGGRITYLYKIQVQTKTTHPAPPRHHQRTTITTTTTTTTKNISLSPHNTITNNNSNNYNNINVFTVVGWCLSLFKLSMLFASEKKYLQLRLATFLQKAFDVRNTVLAGQMLNLWGFTLI